MSQPPELKGGLGFSFSVGAPPQIQTPPLRLVVMGDFSGAGSVSLGPVEATTDELDQLWVRLSRELVLEVPDHLSGGNKTLFVKIPVANLSDFTPAAVLERLPQLAPVKELALALEQHKASADPAPVERAAQGCFGVPALATLLDRVMRELGAAGPAATPAPAAPAPAKQAEKDEGDGALDRILGMVDMGSSSPPEAQNTAAKSAVGALISGVVGANRGKPAEPASGAAAKGGPLAECLAEVRQLLALQFWAVMHHPQFQRAESTWRGLRLLLRKCNFRKGLQLDLLDVSWADAAQAFSLHVHEPEMAGTSSLTPSLVVLDYPMGVGDADLEQCQAMAEQAEEVQVTLLTSVELGFFGLDEPAGINDLRLVSSLLDEPQYTKFRALRDKDCARWLGVAQGRFLLRQPYLQGDRGAGGMAEPVAASSDLLWGSPVWLVAALVARSQAEVGWPTEITGLQSGSVEDLPTHIFPGPGGRDMHIPLEAFASQTLGDDLAHRGFIAVTCAPEGDSAYLLRAPILHPPGHFSDPGATDNARRMATLGYQLLVSRMADLLGRHKAQLVSGKGPGEIQAGLQGFFSSLVGGSGQGAGATVNLGQSGNRMLAEIQIRMGREVMNGVSVNFTIPV